METANQAQAYMGDFNFYWPFQYQYQYVYPYQNTLSEFDLDRIADRVVAKLGASKDPLQGLTKAEKQALAKRILESL